MNPPVRTKLTWARYSAGRCYEIESPPSKGCPFCRQIYFEMKPSRLKEMATLDYFSFQPVVTNRSVKCCGMRCPVCGKVHMKDPLLLIGKSNYVMDCSKEICQNDHRFDIQ